MSPTTASGPQSRKYWIGIAIANIAALATLGYWAYSHIVWRTTEKILQTAESLVEEEKKNRIDPAVEKLLTSSKVTLDIMAEDMRLFKKTSFDAIKQLASVENKLSDYKARAEHRLEEATTLENKLNAIINESQVEGEGRWVATFNDRLSAFEEISIIGKWIETGEVGGGATKNSDDLYLVLTFSENSVTVELDQLGVRKEIVVSVYTYECDYNGCELFAGNWSSFHYKVIPLGRDQMMIADLSTQGMNVVFRRQCEESQE